MAVRMTLLALAIVLSVSTAQAQDLEAAIEAYERGAYASAHRLFEETVDRSRVEAEVVEANYYLGLMYLDGLGVEQWECGAVSYLRFAARQGHADAHHRIGLQTFALALEGHYTDWTPSASVLALALFIFAAEQGHEQAAVMRDASQIVLKLTSDELAEAESISSHLPYDRIVSNYFC